MLLRVTSRAWPHRCCRNMAKHGVVPHLVQLGINRWSARQISLAVRIDLQARREGLCRLRCIGSFSHLGHAAALGQVCWVSIELSAGARHWRSLIVLLLLMLMLFWWQSWGTRVGVSLNRCLVKLIVVKSTVCRPSRAKSTCFAAVETMVSELSCRRRLTDVKVIMYVAGATSSSHTWCTIIPEHGRVDFLVLSCCFLEEAELGRLWRACFVVSLISKVSRLVQLKWVNIALYVNWVRVGRSRRI